jgi:4-diphosphocytidyl-2-C-methyl-D-erythritol kinase
MSSPRAVAVPAYAKINLTLAVLGKRADGYHELASILQTVSLHDTLRIAPTSGGGALTCAADVPALRSPHNLALRAAELLRRELDDPSLGAQIELHKEIPIQGGMGGGSSDAAAVLLALNRLWGAALPDERLMGLAARLGSDVPYFIVGGTARIGGRGEIVVPLPDVAPLWLVLARPPVGVSTAAVFRSLSPSDYGTAADTDAVEQAIRSGEPPPLDRLTNTLEAHVAARYPAVAAARGVLGQAGAPMVRMSGSGPTLYVPFRGRDEAATVYAEASRRGLRVWLARTVGREEYHAAITGQIESPQ